MLITRPNPDGLALQQQLAAKGLKSFVQPLFYMQAGRQLQQLSTHLASADIVIAVSKHAIAFAAQSISFWPPNKQYFAVGYATQKAWQKQGVQHVHTPTDNRSEGLLELPQLQSVKHSNIVILRGQSGRELLYEHLIERQANVHYCECYQRQAVPFDAQSQFNAWQQANVEQVVITSAEQLVRLHELCPKDQLVWLYSRQLITVSERIIVHAQRLGFKITQLSSGASNAALFEAVTVQLEKG
ncbi:uroporphyrinogen-III synthase [Echinimonas agarilytica]|uniref:Uroporphyrinogen-III synthase n=1 Tax=Echinimonas agarilytica TaxID=1215918 RepID=A0AA41W3R0_9GAMM|nr:uroporphyrinogen-III synthase [Echinimonas agarilytica]